MLDVLMYLYTMYEFIYLDDSVLKFESCWNHRAVLR